MCLIRNFQECTIDMNIGEGDIERVSLIPGDIAIRQKSMTAFTFKDIKLVYANEKKKDRGIQMTLRIKRKIISEMMTTYFPSFLLLMITYATTFFKPFFFEAALSVNLTTMLVMTTIFMSKMESLPTADIRMIDFWLIICQMVPFAEVVLLTAKEYFREEEVQENETYERKEMSGKVIIPENHDEGNVHLQLEDGPRAAWANVALNWKKIKFLPALAVIGKIILNNLLLVLFVFLHFSSFCNT